MRIAAILPILSLLLLLFAGCKAEPADAGVPRSETAPALETTTASPYDSVWVENEFTALVPRPPFTIRSFSATQRRLTVLFADAELASLRSYRDELAEAGFTENAETQDLQVAGVTVFRYEASNAEGYTVQLFSNPGAAGISIDK